MASRFVTCSAALRLCDLHSRRPQISLFACAAVVSAIVYLLDHRLLRWRLSGKEVEGDRIWKNLRRFSGWTCAGFIAGAVGFSSTLRGNALRYESLVPGISPAADVKCTNCRLLLLGILCLSSFSCPFIFFASYLP